MFLITQLFASTPSSRLNTQYSHSSCGLVLTWKDNILLLVTTLDQYITIIYCVKKKGYLLEHIGWNRRRHECPWCLQAHVFRLLCHASEHTSTQFGLTGASMLSLGRSPPPPTYSSSMTQICKRHLPANRQKRGIIIHLRVRNRTLSLPYIGVGLIALI